MQALSGKTALVTGGAKHIGRAIALALAGAGADVAITYLESARAAQATVRDMGALGVKAFALRCDVRDERSIARAARAIADNFGGVDVLVNNAAVYETVDFDRISAAQWERMLQTNTRGPYLVARAFAASLKKRHGRIISLGSLGGARPWVTHAHYCVSKAGLAMLTQVMAKAWAPEIAVNAVAPGMIETGVRSDRKLREKTPMRRNGAPEDVVEAVMFFAGATHFITGQVLTVDGGLGLS